MRFADSTASLLICWRQLRDDELHQGLNNIRQIRRAGFRLRMDYSICWIGRSCCPSVLRRPPDRTGSIWICSTGLAV